MDSISENPSFLETEKKTGVLIPSVRGHQYYPEWTPEAKRFQRDCLWQSPDIWLDPPASNTGGKSGGESVDARAPSGAIVDWLSFTLPGFGRDEASVKEVLAVLLPAIGAETAILRRVGLNGYENSAFIDSAGCVIAWGGDHQRDTLYVSMPGGACALVGDWPALAGLLTRLNAKLTRVDLAHDDCSGSQGSWSDWLIRSQGDAFVSGGRRPKCRTVRDESPDSPSGNTLYIGSRSAGKLLRIYEKGKQLGNSSSPWVRLEVEFHNKDRVLPVAMLLNPGSYLAGSYGSTLAFVHRAYQVAVKTIRRLTEVWTVTRSLQSLRRQYGATLHHLMEAFGGCAEDLMDCLIKNPVVSRPPGDVLFSVSS